MICIAAFLLLLTTVPRPIQMGESFANIIADLLDKTGGSPTRVLNPDILPINDQLPLDAGADLPPLLDPDQIDAWRY
jgi:hypothetical protein